MNLVDKIFFDPISKSLKFLGRSGQIFSPVSHEYVYNTNTTNTADTTSFATGAEGIAISASFAGVSKRVRFKNIPMPGDLNLLEFYDTAGAAILWSPLGIFQKVNTDTINCLRFESAAGYGAAMRAVAATPTDMDVNFSLYAQFAGTTIGSAGTPWSAYTGVKWRVHKISWGF